MAAAMARAVRRAALSPIMHSPKRSISSSRRPPLLFSRRGLVHFSPASASRFSPIRCWSDNCGSQTGDPVAENGDNGRWVILMKKPCESSSRADLVDAYIDTLAKVVGSADEAFNRIYKVSCLRHYGFGCRIDQETLNKLKGLPGVLDVYPDCNANPYGGEDRAVQGTSEQAIKWHWRPED